MVRLLGLTLAVAVAIGVSAAGAQTDGTASSRIQSIAGVVKAVSASSLTVDRGGSEIVFLVDSSTRLIAKGGQPRDLVYRIPERRPGLTDIVKSGDRVTVRYRRSARLNAVEVRVVQK